MQVVIGTRGSHLALVQAQTVQKILANAYPENEFVLKIIKTKGDRIQNVALDKIGDKGLFVREIEKELLAHSIHMAVHSMKDMPFELPDGLCFAEAWKREDARDVLVLRTADSLENLKKGAVIGTGSRRRACQLKLLRPDLNIVNIRGNVDTRIAKMHTEEMDGIVLAAAGLKRLGREELVTQYLEPCQMIPAAAQGQLAIELRKDNKDLLSKVSAFSDTDAESAVQTERLFLQKTGGGCHMPVGAYASILPDKRIKLLAFYGNTDGTKSARCMVTGDTPEDVAAQAAAECMAQAKN